MTGCLQPSQHQSRDPGTSGKGPAPAKIPYNAILRKCMVKGSGSGKLSGVRVGVKDNISVSGMPMTCGSYFLSNHIPDTDATVVQRILDEGGNIVAMLNMDDFAWSGSGETSVFGPVRNPHNTEYLAGRLLCRFRRRPFLQRH